MADGFTVTAGASGVTTAAMAQGLTKMDDPSVMRYVVYDFGEYALYFGDLVTICGLGVAVISALIALSRTKRQKDGR